MITFWLCFASVAAQGTSLLDGLLMGIDIDDLLSDVALLLGDPNTVGNSSLDNSEIITTVEDAGFDLNDSSWMEDVNLEEVAGALYDVTLYLEILAAKGVVDLTAYPQLGAVEAALENYGYPVLYSLSDIVNYLESSLTTLPITDKYSGNLEFIIEALQEINNGSEGAPALEEVLLLLGTLIAELQAETDGGEMAYVDSLVDLQVVYPILELFSKDPTEVQIMLLEELLTLINEVGYDFDGLDAELGSGWQNKFEDVIQAFLEADDETTSACAYDLIDYTLSVPIDVGFCWATTCWNVLFGDRGPCACFNKRNPFQEAISSSANCPSVMESSSIFCNFKAVCLPGIRETFDQQQDLEALLSLGGGL